MSQHLSHPLPLRTCQWLCEKHKWQDCGKPASMYLPALGIAYCDFHGNAAQAMMPTLNTQPIATHPQQTEQQE